MTSLLPHENVDPTELAISEAVDAWWSDVDPSIISTIWNPDTCPVQVLPYLANALDVPVWRPDWPEKTQRETIKLAIRASRLRGTRTGFAIVARMAGSELLKATFPPDKSYAAPSLTADEKETFVRRYPELRVYDFRSGGTAGFGSFPSWKSYFSDPSGDSGEKTTRFPTVSGAVARYGKQGYVYRKGVETKLTTEVRTQTTTAGEATSYTEVRERGRTVGAFVGQTLHGYLCNHKAASRIYRMRLSQRYETTEDRVWFKTVRPGLDTLGYQAEPVAVRGTRKLTVFTDGSYVGSAPMKSDAGDRLFSRTWLFDPSVPVISRGRSMHMGTSRLGMPAYHAELVVRIRNKRPIEQSAKYCFGYLVETPKTKYHETLDALKWAKLGRDKVLVRTKTVEPVTFGRSVYFGSQVVGGLQEIY